MNDLDDIERRVAALSPAELEHFRPWVAEFDASARDARMERDAAAGRLAARAQGAAGAHRAGTTGPP